VLPLATLIATLITGLLLVARIRSRTARRIRTPFTKFMFDEQVHNYWDGSAWQPIISRYAPAARVSYPLRPGESSG
jgi:hypothetical protein